MKKKFFIIPLLLLFIILIRIVYIYNPSSPRIKGYIDITYNDIPIELNQDNYFNISQEKDSDINYNYILQNNKIIFKIYTKEYTIYNFEFNTNFDEIIACFKYLNLNDNAISDIVYNINYYYYNNELYADINIESKEVKYLFFKKSNSISKTINITKNPAEISDLKYAMCLGG